MVSQGEGAVSMLNERADYTMEAEGWQKKKAKIYGTVVI
jgi:hypothetical protein